MSDGAPPLTPPGFVELDKRLEQAEARLDGLSRDSAHTYSNEIVTRERFFKILSRLDTVETTLREVAKGVQELLLRKGTP